MNTFISMSAKEVERHQLIEEVRNGRMDVAEAAERSCVSQRTVFRWQAAVISEGVKGLIHGNRGRPSAQAVPKKERNRIIRIVKRTYLDCTAELITEKLEEEHGIVRDPKTVAGILRASGIWESPMARRTGRTKSAHRSWRERRSRLGDMVQFDGSYHDWFEGRRNIGETCLLAAIDDASSTVLHAEFAPDEGVLAVMGFWLGYAEKNGLPKSMYVDKFSTYRMPEAKAEMNPDTKTQLARAMETVGTKMIFANSSQAKGRVERLFRTLQDRLIKELRFKNISSVEGANRFLKEKYLPAFNRRFAVPPKEEADVHRPVGARDLEGLRQVFVRREERIVQHDFTVAFRNQWYQVLPSVRLAVRPKDPVEIREYPDAALGFFVRDKTLQVIPIPKRLPREQRLTPKTMILTLTN